MSVQQQQDVGNLISPLSLSSEEQQNRKSSTGSTGSTNSSGSFKKNLQIFNSLSSSVNSEDVGSTLISPRKNNNINNTNINFPNKLKVTDLVKTFNNKPLSNIHSIHNNIAPSTLEKEKNSLPNGSNTKQLSSAFQILDNSINTPLLSTNNRVRSGSTGSKPIIMQTQMPSSISISASSSPPLSSDDQLHNTNKLNSSNPSTNSTPTISVSGQKPPTPKISGSCLNISSNNSNNNNSVLQDLLFNLPMAPTSVPKISQTPPSSKKPTTSTTSSPATIGKSTSSSTTNTTSSANNIAPIFPLPISQSSSTPSTSSSTTPNQTTPRNLNNNNTNTNNTNTNNTNNGTSNISNNSSNSQSQQVNTNSINLITSSSNSNNSQINYINGHPAHISHSNSCSSIINHHESSSPSQSQSSSSSSSSNTPVTTTPILMSNRNSPLLGRSPTQYIISTNTGLTAGERVKSKQYSMLNISKKTIIDESDSLSSPRSLTGSPNSLRASISSQAPASFGTLPSINSNKPLVVKKSTSEHSAKKENIWRQTMAPSTKEDHIKVVFDGLPGKRVIQKFIIDKTPQEIKSKFLEDLLNTTDFQQPPLNIPINPDQYELKVLSVNSTINNETLPLRRQMLMQACNISRLFPKLHLVIKGSSPSSTAIPSPTPSPSTSNTSLGSLITNVPPESLSKLNKSNSSSTLMIDNNEVIDVKGHIQAELEIFELIGTSFTRVLDQGQEVVSFRRDFAHFRLANFTITRNDLSQMIYVSSEPLPLIIPNKITIMVLLPGDGKIIKRVDCDPNESVKEVKNQIFKKFAMIDRNHTKDKTADDFVLKVTGFREYILCHAELGNLTSRQRFYPTGANGDFALIDYDYIRQCVSKNQLIELSLTNNSILKLNQVEEKVSFIDKILETSDFDDYDDEELESLSNNSYDDVKQNQNQQHSQQQIFQSRGSFDSSGGGSGLGEQLSTNSGGSNNNSSNNELLGSAAGVAGTTNNIVGGSNNNSSKLPINIVKRLFRVNIAGIRNLNFNNNEDAKSKFVDKQPYCFVMAELYYGGQLLTNPVYTPITPINIFEVIDFPNWEKGIAFTIPIRVLPRSARASFTLYVTSVSEATESQMEDVVSKSIPIGWSNCLLMNHKGILRMGPAAFRLWEDGRRANPIGTCVDNQSAKAPVILLVEFESFIRPIVYVPPTPSTSNSSNELLNSPPTSPQTATKKLDPEEARKLRSLMESDPLAQFSPEEQKLIYNYKHNYKSKPKALAKFLLSVCWTDPEQVSEAYRQMNDWALLKPVQALELLDAKFADEHVRNFAIKVINSFSDAEFSDFLLQLTQVLKYEPYHNSDLTHILIQRALANRSRIGHFFFWFLKSEMHTPEIEERYGLLLEGYLRSCGSHRQDLIKQNQVLKSLYGVAMAVKNTHGASERKKVLQEGLSKIKFPETFQLPLDPRWEAKGLIVDKCRYMDSKKLPLWLVFENVEPHAKPLTIIFKVGDDLRQDILTLQVLRIMDRFWKNNGMDLRLQPYKCIATGDGIGMLEVVLNSNTIANINKDAGGTGAILEEKTLANWLKECNPTEAEYNKAVETFILSCAGYVVATYVLGIGDRHADNIMITKFGHLFHIDFGHFLGNYKKKYGFKRERAPFIFTPQYMAIVGGKDSENFKRFVTTCCLAYNILRKNSDLFLNLFQLMLSTGIPELQCADDIDYLRKALAPQLTDEEAAEEFKKNIIVALNTKTVILNDLFHNFAH
ncbi:hypothetical protein DICPUDRAFT_52203 [Dictyostelium purpureum]|uniref:phosphatidylinositol 3-kinase n=1 Tax=Dictyostelium purpureum TaxID=5786 RepID=F0Z7E7_DICPU|nr:uncharacterized protein DICPUDRAFT_52203 [Dictyostelium purpureum]EGC40128.1 hypothetical protein DICPUDRAFT_52203 [Dictyostelium purpureum]|eukprot:XP_003283318.1 hypothetical protein DICPUDRAFT_52203 [Dictyostelium purpureum]